MSYKEVTKKSIAQIPDSKMYYTFAYLHGTAIPKEIPHAENII